MSCSDSKKDTVPGGRYKPWPKRVGGKSYRDQVRRSSEFLMSRTSLSTLLTPRSALCWTLTPDAGSGEATGLLYFRLSLILPQSSASPLYQFATGGAPVTYRLYGRRFAAQLTLPWRRHILRRVPAQSGPFSNSILSFLPL